MFGRWNTFFFPSIYSQIPQIFRLTRVGERDREFQEERKKEKKKVSEKGSEKKKDFILHFIDCTHFSIPCPQKELFCSSFLVIFRSLPDFLLPLTISLTPSLTHSLLLSLSPNLGRLTNTHSLTTCLFIHFSVPLSSLFSLNPRVILSSSLSLTFSLFLFQNFYPYSIV